MRPLTDWAQAPTCTNNKTLVGRGWAGPVTDTLAAVRMAVGVCGTGLSSLRASRACSLSHTVCFPYGAPCDLKEPGEVDAFTHLLRALGRLGVGKMEMRKSPALRGESSWGWGHIPCSYRAHMYLQL